MSYILESSKEDQIQRQQNHIKRILYTIQELQRMRKELFDQRRRTETGIFHTTINDFKHSLDYYKIVLHLGSIDYQIEEITRMLIAEDDRLCIEKEYLNRCIQIPDNKLDLVPGVSSDAIMET